MSDQMIVIHGRFEPDGTVTQIAECPSGVAPQQWFDFLSDNAGDSYQTFSGARIVFRLAPDRLEALKTACTAG